jgi:hypothetical protein
MGVFAGLECRMSGAKGRRVRGSGLGGGLRSVMGSLGLMLGWNGGVKYIYLFLFRPPD